METLERLNIHPSRKLGQNFLMDANMLAAESLMARAKHRAIVRNAQKLEAAKKEA